MATSLRFRSIERRPRRATDTARLHRSNPSPCVSRRGHSNGINGRGELINFVLRRTAAVIALWAGAAGSVGLMLYAGHRVGAPRLLLGLFAMWVVSPFVMLAVGYVMSKRWSVLTRATLYGVTPV